MRIPWVTLASLLAVTSALAQPAPEVTLTRLDCGTAAPAGDVGRF